MIPYKQIKNTKTKQTKQKQSQVSNRYLFLQMCIWSLKYTEHCHSSGFGLLETRWPLPFLRQANRGIWSLNHLRTFTEGLMCTQASSFWFKFSDSCQIPQAALAACWGQALLRRTFSLFWAPPWWLPALPRSGSDGEIQVEAKHISVASFILSDTQAFYSLHKQPKMQFQWLPLHHQITVNL